MAIMTPANTPKPLLEIVRSQRDLLVHPVQWSLRHLEMVGCRFGCRSEEKSRSGNGPQGGVYFEYHETLIKEGDRSENVSHWLRLVELAVAGTMYWMNHAQRYTRAGKHPEYASRGEDKLGDLLRPEREISCITWGIHETREPLEVWEDLKLTK
ncbi:hypothetical protein BJX68DRAFT_247066 [Aspergillus pseudodeflectus]|uniref:Uncharacterized protein n=1 Tax=Aspergillus pseudodeflectus TaxID=176178 RepID=A0ABR4JJ98_9EURO